MAKTRKGSKYELDDFGFDPSLDVPDFNFDGPGVKDDRKPVSKMASGFKSGVKSTVKSPQFLRKVLKEALPKGYGSAMDFTDEAAGTLRDLYNNAAKEVKPALNDLKRTTSRVLPKADKYLPKKVSDRLKKWSDSAESEYASSSQEAFRDAQIASQLGDIFKYQAEEGARRDAEGFVKDKLKEGIDQARHRDQIGQLNAIRQTLAQTAAYRLNVESKFQRKSLELQFRQFFLARDMFEEQKRQNALVEGKLDAITKNTGLPEFVKLQHTEALKQAMRNKFIGSLHDGLFGRRANFVRNLGAKASDLVMDRVKGFAGGVRQGLDQANMAGEMASGMGADPYEMAGNLAGSAATDWAGGSLGRKLGKRLAKNKKLVRGGNRIQQTLNNLPQIAGEWSRSNKGETGIGILDWLLNFGKDTVSASLGGTDTKMQIDGVDNLNAPSMFSRHALKSITEVIPGFLARIHQELRILRTGDANTELTTYDLTKNQFVSKTKAAKNAVSSVFGGFGKESTREQVDTLLNKIDPNGTLSNAQRKELGQTLLKDNMANRYGDKRRLTNERAYKSPNGKLYADLFSKHLENDELGSKELEINRQFSNLGSSVDDARAKIQELINLGQSDALIDAGILNAETGEIDLKRFYDYHYGDEGYNPTGAARKGRRKTPGFQDGGLHRGGARVVGEDGPELEVTGAARYYNKRETEEMLRKTGTQSAQDDTNTLLMEMLATLTRMEQRMGSGMGGGQSGPFKFDISVSKGLRKLGRGLRWSAGKAAGFAGGVANTAQKALGLGWDAVGMAGRGAIGAIKGLHDRVSGIRDVYVKGEKIPRLTAWKIKAGEYRDQATGKVIKSYKDIAGAVVDSEGSVVLNADEVKKAFIREGMVVKTIDALGAVLKGAGKLGNSLVSGLPGVLKGVWGVVKSTFGLLSLPQDVYVRGQRDPVLLARVMRGGGYFSQHSGRTIDHPGQIDGPVIDREGNVVLSTEDMRGGLLDKNGKPIRTGLAKLANGMLAVARPLVKGALAAGKKVGEMAWEGFKATGSLLKNVFKDGGLHIGIGGGGPGKHMKSAVEVLHEIRDILLQRLKDPKKSWSDVDGDGDREGSWQDILQRQREKKAGAQGDKAKAGEGASSGLGLGGGLMGLLNKLRGKDKEEEEGSLLSDAADVADIAESTGGRRGKLRRGAGRVGGWLGKAGKGAWGAAKVAGSLATTWMGLGGLGSTAAAAGSTALAAGGTAMGAIGSGLAAAGTGLAALLASPVVLGALAVAAVGTAGYLGYKYLTRKQVGPVSKVRYAQYGFLPEDTEHVGAVFGLEDKLQKALVWKDGQPSLDGTKMTQEEMVGDFGLDLKDAGQLRAFATWFNGRFKPVFLTHTAALKAAAPSKGSLGAVDSLEGPEKKRYLELSRFAEGNYALLISPFPGGARLAADASVVSKLADEAQAEASKAGEPDSSKSGLAKAGQASVGAAVGAKVGEAAASAPSAPSPVSTAQALQEPKGTGMTTVAATFTGYSRSGGAADALSSIRFKSYGLHELVLEKARALDQLEADVLKNVTFSGQGIATFEGSIDKILQRAGPSFGIAGINNDAAYDWKSWFNGRFLPVFLNFATAMYKATGRIDLQAGAKLKAQDLVDIASATYTTPGVWQAPFTPWPGFVLNTDPSSVESNFQALKESAKKVVLDEQVGTKSPAGAGADNGTGLTDGTNGRGQSISSRVWGAAKNAASAVWDGLKSGVEKASSGLADAAYGVTHGNGPSMLTGGARAGEISDGTGGAMDQLPIPQGDGKYEYFQELFARVAKMVGVDPKLLATMAAIESGFRSTVKAGTSSATGLFQFIRGTWDTMVRKYGKKYGIGPNTPPTDARANALMGAEFIKENAQALKPVKGELSDTDLYLAHFLGAGGAKQFFRADPNAVAATVMPQAANANRSIFYEADGRPRTIAAVYAEINRRVRMKGKQFGLDAGQGTLDSVKGAAPQAPAAPGVSVPVSEQVAAPTANTGPMPVSASPASAPASTADPAAQAAGGGFSPSAGRSEAISATQRAQREELSSALVPLGEKSLAVQSDMLVALRSIEKLIANRFGSQAEAAKAQQQTAASAGAQPTREMVRAPVSMAKTSSSW